MPKHKATFSTLSPDETKLSYRDNKFLLIEKDRGVYGLGRSVSLYKLEGFDKKHLVELGWTQTDNHGGPAKSGILRGVVTLEQCKTAALKYIDSLMD
jgi:hypothetical protein